MIINYRWPDAIKSWRPSSLPALPLKPFAIGFRWRNAALSALGCEFAKTLEFCEIDGLAVLMLPPSGSQPTPDGRRGARQGAARTGARAEGRRIRAV
jgi:hypothetical protein